MDRFDAMRIFTRVAERRSFSLAAEDLGVPRSTVTDAVKLLERRLGVRLLERTTRVVRPTLDGEAYYQRCGRLIGGSRRRRSRLQRGKNLGLLRVDLHGTQRAISGCPASRIFWEQFPTSAPHQRTHQPMDIVRGGLRLHRAGGIRYRDSSLIQRKLVNSSADVRSPSYLAKFRTPEVPEDLEDGHRMIGPARAGHGLYRSLGFLTMACTRDAPATSSPLRAPRPT